VSVEVDDYWSVVGRVFVFAFFVVDRRVIYLSCECG